MKPPVCDSVFDVAVWLMDRALNDGEYMQPQKLQRLLYLAQAYYGAGSKGQKLMPCIFVATALGPLEPSSWRAFENGRPQVAVLPVPEMQMHFLDSLWRRFGVHSADYLTRMTKGHHPYRQAMIAGARSEIAFEEMVVFYGRKREDRGSASDDNVPALDRVVRPRVLKSHKGRPVSVQAWSPKRKMAVDSGGGGG